MKKQKPSGPAKPAASAAPVEAQDDALAMKLVGLALDLRELDVYASPPEALKKTQADFHKLIRKCLQQKKDATLREALELAFEENAAACAVLEAAVEELAGTVVVRRDDGPAVEVNAFVVPMFVQSTGGLRAEQCFQDEQAFDALRDSFREGGLESRRANVVLVSHAYHLDEIDRIGYSQLNDMVLEAHEAMTRRKAPAAPAIARSMSGWPENGFAADDSAVELRFLLGFALKTLDDPFYKVPDKEAAADRYFEARSERFRQWARQVAPLVTRCLATDGREIGIDFLYQDLFYGGKATALDEYRMLQMMTALREALHAAGVAPQDARAVVGPADDDGMALRVQLRAMADDRLLASFDKPVAMQGDPRIATDDIRDALATLGVRSVAPASRFDDGEPVGARPGSPP